jgi:hypothetical protein
VVVVLVRVLVVRLVVRLLVLVRQLLAQHLAQRTAPVAVVATGGVRQQETAVRELLFSLCLHRQ